jgi:WG containing repeat
LFSDGLAAVRLGSKYGYIDKTGKLVIHPQFDLVLNFTDGLALVLCGGNKPADR